MCGRLCAGGTRSHGGNRTETMLAGGSQLWKGLQVEHTFGQSWTHGRSERRLVMSIAKVIEITAESNKSFEDAIQQGIAGATETLQNVRSAWVKEQQVIVRDNKIEAYRVDLKVTFVVERGSA
jgi:dodecin